jgi:hypothetical protein
MANFDCDITKDLDENLRSRVFNWKYCVIVVNGQELFIKSYKSGRYRWHECIIPDIIKPIIDNKKAKGSRFND